MKQIQIIRDVVTRDIFNNYNIPEEFGDKFEIVIFPLKEKLFEEMSDKEKWERYGYWEPNSETMDMSVDYALNCIYDNSEDL